MLYDKFIKFFLIIVNLMKAQFVIKFYFFALLFDFLMINVSCIKHTLSSIINEKISIGNSNELKNILDISFLKANETFYKINDIPTNEFSSNQTIKNNKTLFKDRKEAQFLKISASIASNMIPTYDSSNITHKFNCFFFNEKDFSVYDMSQLDKEE